LATACCCALHLRRCSIHSTMFRRILALVLLILALCALGAQEVQEAKDAKETQLIQETREVQQAEESKEVPGQSFLDTMSEIERSTLAFDIAVSNFYELKAMAAKYGLPAASTSQELRTSLYAFFNLTAPGSPPIPSSVVIESASKIEYFNLEDSPGRFVRLYGPIIMTLRSEDGFAHRIKADEIVFDEARNIVEARGNVEYLREGEGRTDEFFGSSLLVDLDSYSGMFLDGSYDLDPSQQVQRTLSLFFRKLNRRGSDLSVFEDAIISACDEERPHYYVRAKKVWIFENGDWAIANGTLYVGVVPLLWLPFFYYPSDELFFHPVLGYRSREGAFVQTTSYMIGERAVSGVGTGLMSLLSTTSSGGKGERWGVFIRRITRDNPESGSPSEEQTDAASPGVLKLLADVYSSLGLYLGVQGSFPKLGSGGLDFSVGLGLSRSLFLQSNGFYSPFDYSNNYDSAWNYSNFLGLRLPFRYGMDFTYTSSQSAGLVKTSFKATLPLFSDPYFETDFYQRKESSALFSILETNKTAVSVRSSMNQSIATSLSWRLPQDKTAGLVESVDVSRLAAQMNWKSKAQSTSGLDAKSRRLLYATPSRDFFYPDSLKILDTALNASGTLASFDTKPENAEKKSGESSRNYSMLNGKLGWTASGSAGLEDKFRASAWSYPEDVDASLSYRLLGWKASARLSSSLAWAQGLFTLETGLGINSQDQYRLYLFDERSAPVTVHPYRLSDYAYSATALDGSGSLSLSPFPKDSVFSSSTLRYQAGGTLFRRAFSGISGAGTDASPLYSSTWISWNRSSFSTHSLTATFALNPPSTDETGFLKGVRHSLSFQASLPPLLEKYSSNYSLSGRYLGASITGSIARAAEGVDLLPSALSAQFSLGAAPYPVFKSTFSWDFLTSQPLSSISSLEYQWAKTSFTIKKSKGYTFNEGSWILDGTESFRPYEFSLSMAPSFSFSSRRDNSENDDAKSAEVVAAAARGLDLMLDLKPSLSYIQNAIRFTESVITAGLDLSLQGGKGTSLLFSGRSTNKSAWRYWPGFFEVTENFDPSDYARNPFIDVLDSLSIWDNQALRRTLFKLQSLSLSLAQDLHDWAVSAGLAMSPVLITPDSGRPYYQLEFSFNFLVSWKDLPELKSSVTYDDGSFQR